LEEVQVDQQIKLPALLKMVVRVEVHLGLQVLLKGPELLVKEITVARKMTAMQDLLQVEVAAEVHRRVKRVVLERAHLIHSVELLRFMLQVVMVKELQTLSTQT
jgi:predicted nucleic acid-binding protein